LVFCSTKTLLNITSLLYKNYIIQLHKIMQYSYTKVIEYSYIKVIEYGYTKIMQYSYTKVIKLKLIEKWFLPIKNNQK
jgi:hypothetical protein